MKPIPYTLNPFCLSSAVSWSLSDANRTTARSSSARQVLEEEVVVVEEEEVVVEVVVVVDGGRLCSRHRSMEIRLEVLPCVCVCVCARARACVCQGFISDVCVCIVRKAARSKVCIVPGSTARGGAGGGGCGRSGGMASSCRCACVFLVSSRGPLPPRPSIAFHGGCGNHPTVGTRA